MHPFFVSYKDGGWRLCVDFLGYARYEYVLMPFGLKNALALLQHVIHMRSICLFMQTEVPYRGFPMSAEQMKPYFEFLFVGMTVNLVKLLALRQ